MVSNNYECENQMDIYEYLEALERKEAYDKFSKYMNPPVAEEGEQVGIIGKATTGKNKRRIRNV